MQTTYTYKEQNYSNLYELSEVLGKEGIFIPLSITDEALKELEVDVKHEEESLESVKEHKILTLKIQRDNLEVEPIAYNGHSYDYDSKARDRISAAIIALELQGEGATIEWTTADNDDTPVTANDLKMIIAAVAVRSNKLHTAYRVAKEKVEAATTAAEVEAVTMEV
jgi:hypothetical protein